MQYIEVSGSPEYSEYPEYSFQDPPPSVIHGSMTLATFCLLCYAFEGKPLKNPVAGVCLMLVSNVWPIVFFMALILAAATGMSKVGEA